MNEKKIVHQNKYVTLYSDEGYLVYKTPDIVCVLPVLPNGDVILIEQYRIPLEQRLLELVTGGINDGETPECASIREVKEETGYETQKIEYVGSYYSAPGYVTQKAYVFIAYLGEFSKKELEEHEYEFELKNKVFSRSELDILIRTHTSHPYLSLAFQQLK